MHRQRSPLVLLAVLCAWTAPASQAADGIKPGTPLERKGEEIVVCGQLFHTTAPVVLWTDPGGYDAYRVERRFTPLDQAGWDATKAAGSISSPNRYGTRSRGLSPEQRELVRGGGWDLDILRGVVDQFVIHYDVAGTSKRCFQVLHDSRGLSVHFMLDLDGTIYQTLDLKERAWHATIANDRSVGIEIANMGAYSTKSAGKDDPLAKWYEKTHDGHTRLIIPGGLDKSGIRNRSKPLRPDRDEPVVGTVQGQTLRQYDLTPQQYDSLIKLTATLCTVLPRIKCDYPRDASGKLITSKLPDDQLSAYQGVLGHYHVQTNKTDPGPAFQWDTVIDGARKLMAR
ncbi:MAG: peptidoglycan recognition family protein [Isosphaeraceae bacterium]